MQEGSYYQYIRAIVKFYSGYLQVHKKGYWDDQQLNKAFVYSLETAQIIASEPAVELQSARLESFALASQHGQSRGVMVMGVEPEKESQITGIDARMKAGEYLAAGDSGVLLGMRLAEFLKLSAGDTLRLNAQACGGSDVSGLFRVKGIVKHPSPDFDRKIVYMDIARCRSFYSAPNMATSVVIMVPEDSPTAAIARRMQESLGDAYEVMDWRALNALLIEQIDSDRITGYVMKGILYLVIGFGMLGTLMMMMAERRRELGVMIANGMRKKHLYAVMVTESLLLGLVGAVIGLLLSLPVIAWFSQHPVPISGELAQMMEEMGFSPYLHFSAARRVFTEQALIVLAMSLTLSLYTLLYVRRLNVMKALRSK
jgi:ABC-type lipoprotein release transport system permease subunit